MPKDRRKPQTRGRSRNSPDSTLDLPRWKKALYGLVTTVVLLLLLEGVLALLGIRPVLNTEDPFVGFASNVPLFVEATGPQGEELLRTAPNKRLFNQQQFLRDKSADTYRIFCVGGSTTFGRPFGDSSSFAGWLRELLPIAHPDRDWEVVNAGGVSYASYRVARLMEELSAYDPDLFIVYTGQNEFLEERTYRTLRSTPSVVRNGVALLAQTRVWAAMKVALTRVGWVASSDPESGSTLAEEADTLLEHFGPDVYERDDALREQVLDHYRFSLERMVGIARRAGADILFVVPASNVKDCSPFKSEHTDGLAEEEHEQSLELLAAAKERLEQGEWSEALIQLDRAIEVDPRYAEHHYRRGKALLGLGRTEEAHAAFTRAVVEDVCPLRALPEMSVIVEDVARTTGKPFIDFARIIEDEAREEFGAPILGEEYFLDHVHPTIAGNGMLGVRLVEQILALEGLPASESWGDAAVTEAGRSIQERIAPADQALALSNLAKVMAWSGKLEDAVRPANDALSLGIDDPLVVSPAANILATHYALKGDDEKERHYYRVALNATPRSPELHWRIGLRALERDPPEVERACAHVFFASVYWEGPHRDAPHRVLGGILAERGRWRAALSHYLEARSLAPGDAELQASVARVAERLGPAATSVETPKVTVDEYPSGALRRIVQVRVDPAGTVVPDGIWTEWSENGEPLRYVEMQDGRPLDAGRSWSEGAR